MLAVAVLSQMILAGCAVRIQPAPYVASSGVTASPVRDVTIVFWFGSGVPQCAQQSEAYLSTFRSAMAARVPAIFAANGIPVAQTIVETRPVKYRRAGNGELALPQLGGIKTSHAVLLTVDTYSYSGRCAPGSNVDVNFDARVWDVQKQRMVWSGEPTLALVLKQPLLRSQHFAASLLNGFHKAGLIKLNGGEAVDLNGQPVGSNFIWEDDK